MREGGTAAPGNWKLGPEASLGEHNAADLRSEHAASYASEVADENTFQICQDFMSLRRMSHDERVHGD